MRSRRRKRNREREKDKERERWERERERLSAEARLYCENQRSSAFNQNHMQALPWPNQMNERLFWTKPRCVTASWYSLANVAAIFPPHTVRLYTRESSAGRNGISEWLFPSCGFRKVLLLFTTVSTRAFIKQNSEWEIAFLSNWNLGLNPLNRFMKSKYKKEK